MIREENLTKTVVEIKALQDEIEREIKKLSKQYRQVHRHRPRVRPLHHHRLQCLARRMEPVLCRHRPLRPDHHRAHRRALRTYHRRALRPDHHRAHHRDHRRDHHRALRLDLHRDHPRALRQAPPRHHQNIELKYLEQSIYAIYFGLPSTAMEYFKRSFGSRDLPGPNSDLSRLGSQKAIDLFIRNQCLLTKEFRTMPHSSLDVNFLCERIP
jgi:hypothetical protein